MQFVVRIRKFLYVGFRKSLFVIKIKKIVMISVIPEDQPDNQEIFAIDLPNDKILHVNAYLPRRLL